MLGGQPCLGEVGPCHLQDLLTLTWMSSVWFNLYRPPTLSTLGWVLRMNKTGSQPSRGLQPGRKAACVVLSLADSFLIHGGSLAAEGSMEMSWPLTEGTVGGRSSG